MGVETAAIVVAILSVFVCPVRGDDVRICLLIIALGLVASELDRSVEAKRRRLADNPHVNFSSVWTVAAVFLLPPVLAAVVAAVLYAHLGIRVWRGLTEPRPHRIVFSACNVMLACQAAAWVARSTGLGHLTIELTFSGVLLVVLVLATYFTTSLVLVATVIALAKPERRLTRLLGSWNENLLELSTLCMGVVMAVLLGGKPWLAVLVLLPLHALHRSVLVRQFERAAARDSKTGLLNATSWNTVAESELRQAKEQGSPLGVLMIDLDYFRKVNNTFGHLIGDTALRAVGDALRAEVRSDDLCGRFGGDEFSVLLPGASLDDLVPIAERIRRRILDVQLPDDAAGYQLSVSIGAASYPEAGEDLTDLLRVADVALIGAKDSGRNMVAVQTPKPVAARDTSD